MPRRRTTPRSGRRRCRRRLPSSRPESAVGSPRAAAGRLEPGGDMEASHTRRDVLRLGVAGAGAVAGARLLGASDAAAAPGSREQRAHAVKRSGTIRDVEHIVVIIQENRSFDHYFGMRKDVRGFGDTEVMDAA